MFRERAGYSPQLNNSVEKQQLLDTLERFKKAPFKIALQKDGELTQISKHIFAEELGIIVPERTAKERRLVDVSPDGIYGYVHARNKDICGLVARGDVDIAVVGSDRVFESKLGDKVVTVSEYDGTDEWKWPIVIATAETADITDLSQIKSVATQYPEIAGQFFEEMGHEVAIIQSSGGTEAYPHIGVDAIIDLTSTGASLEANGLTKWEPAIFTVSPVMIVNRESMDKYVQQKDFYEQSQSF